MHVTLAFIDDAMEAMLLRALFENLHCRVDWRPIGRPSDFFTAFEGTGELGVVSGHGDEKGFVFPEMAPGIDSLTLPDNRISPALLEGFSRLPPVLLSTACGSGTAAFAAAFHANGVGLYIAPMGYPDGAAVPILVGLAAYLVIERHLGWPEAIEQANSQLAPENHFRVFEAAAA